MIGGAGSAIVLLMQEFGNDLQATVNGLINWCVLLLGVGVLSFFYFLTFIEFSLGSLGVVFRDSSCLPLGFAYAFCLRNLERGGPKLGKSSCCPYFYRNCC